MTYLDNVVLPFGRIYLTHRQVPAVRLGITRQPSFRATHARRSVWRTNAAKTANGGG